MNYMGFSIREYFGTIPSGKPAGDLTLLLLNSHQVALNQNFAPEHFQAFAVFQNLLQTGYYRAFLVHKENVIYKKSLGSLHRTIVEYDMAEIQGLLIFEWKEKFYSSYI